MAHATGMGLEYQKMLLTKVDRIVTTDSKITLRDNSCIEFTRGGLRSAGIVKKIFRIPSTNDVFITVYPLERSAGKLCTDDTTNAGIDILIYGSSFLPGGMYTHGPTSLPDR